MEQMKKPTFMQEYWLWVYEDGDWYISFARYNNTYFHLTNMESGNCFESYEECESHPEVRDCLAKHIAKEPTL